MRHVLLLVLVLTAAVASAQDPCATAIPLPCDTQNLSFPIGAGGWTVPASVCGGPVISCSASLFEITLTTTSNLSVDLAFPGGLGAPQLFLLQDCAGINCITSTNVTGDMTWTNCLPPGTYYLVLNEQTCLFYNFTIGLTCDPCSDPVSAEDVSDWGALKSLYR